MAERLDGLLVTCSGTTTTLIIVPTEFQLPLTRAHHATLSHAGARRVAGAIREKYAWKRMMATIASVIKECSRCLLAKARFNSAHGLMRAHEVSLPRQSYGFDIYSIAIDDYGCTCVLTVVDMSSRWVIFVPMANHTAQSVINAFLTHVMYASGFASEVTSDSASQFVGRDVSGLFEAFNISHRIVTYNPGANGVCERPHAILGEALRLISDPDMAHWSTVVARVAFAINTTKNSNTGFSPFQLEHGSAPHLPVDLPLLPTPSPPSSTESIAGLYSGIATAVTLYQSLAAASSVKNRRATNDRKNNSARPPKIYQTDDKVCFYVPDRTAGPRMHKHRVAWRGPGTIMTQLSPSTYTIKDDATGKVYMRSLNCIRAWTPSQERIPRTAVARADRSATAVTRIRRHGAGPGSALDTPHPLDPARPIVGSVIAALDEPDSKAFWIAKVTSLTETGYILHYMTTTTASLRTCRFLPSWIEKSTARIIRTITAPREHASPWTGTCHEDCVLAPRIVLKANNQLTAASLKLVVATRIGHATVA